MWKWTVIGTLVVVAWALATQVGGEQSIVVGPQLTTPPVVEPTPMIVESPLDADLTAPVLVAPQLEEIPAPLAAPVEPTPLATAAPTLIPVADVKYKLRPSARRMLEQHGTIDFVLAVDNPQDASDCLYEVPVFVPGCCQGDPLVQPRSGLLGRGVVEYCWPNGYQVAVIFRLRGDVVVRANAH